MMIFISIVEKKYKFGYGCGLEVFDKIHAIRWIMSKNALSSYKSLYRTTTFSFI